MKFNRTTLKIADEIMHAEPDIWASDNGIWHIYVRVNCNYLDFYPTEHASSFIIGVANETYSDYPLKNDNGTIAYYSPNAIPKYVKKQVEKIARSIGQFQGKVFHNPDFDKVLAMLKD